MVGINKIISKKDTNVVEHIDTFSVKGFTLVFKDDFPEEKVTYAISYLSGNETDNPVYFEGEEDPCMADSEIIFDEVEEDDSLLDRFNKMAVESSK